MSKPLHQQPGIRASYYQPLSDSDCATIADAAFRILEESGVAVHSESALTAFERAGAVVSREQQQVRLPRRLVEDAIASAPSSVTLHSREGRDDAVLEKNRVHYGTGGTAIYVLDPSTGERRPSVSGDVVLNARMVEALDNVHVFTINVFPNDIENPDHIDVNRFFHALDNTHKHVMGGLYTPQGCQDVVEMCEQLARSAAALVAQPFVSFITLIISPFKIDKRYGEMTCYLARKGLPVVVPTEPMCGTTSPVTLAANVLTHVAETLAGVALVQCVQRGAPAICGSVGSISDLRTMRNLAGPIERGMINAAVAQMAQYFELPLYSTAGTSDAKEVGVQSAYESAMSSLLVALSGANYIHDIAGLMDTDLTVSYEKLVIDNEILGMCQRALRGIEVTDDTLAVDLMIEKGPGRDYLAEDHTVRFMRQEFFKPSLANRDRWEQRQSGDDALSRANSFVERVRNSDSSALLPSPTREQILTRYPQICSAVEPV